MDKHYFYKDTNTSKYYFGDINTTTQGRLIYPGSIVCENVGDNKIMFYDLNGKLIYNGTVQNLVNKNQQIQWGNYSELISTMSDFFVKSAGGISSGVEVINALGYTPASKVSGKVPAEELPSSLAVGTIEAIRSRSLDKAVASKLFDDAVSAMNQKADLVAGKNKFNKATAIDGKYMGPDGSIGSYFDHAMSDFIPVVSGTSYKANVYMRFWCYFDSSKNVVAGGSAFQSAFTVPAGVSYVIVSIDALSKKDTFQLEIGTTATTYEAYKQTLSSSEIPDEVAKKTDLAVYSKKTEIALKADISLNTKNYFNKDATRRTLVPGNKFYTDTFGDNDILVNALCSGWAGNWYFEYNQYSKMSGKIPLSADKPNAVINLPTPAQNTNTILYFDENGVLLSITDAFTKMATWVSGVAYCRFSMPIELDESTVQIEYGTVSTTYEAYDGTLRVLKAQAPKGTVFAEELQTDVETIYGKTPSMVLPSKLYTMAGNPNHFWINSFIKKQQRKVDLNLKLSDTNMFSLFEDLMLSNQSTGKTVSNVLELRALNSLLQSKSIATQSITPQSSPKTVNIWSCGDSLTDLGTWQSCLKPLLAADNITPNFVGSMPIKSDELIFGEAMSGGNMGHITAAGTPAVVLTVSGITTTPITSYPGTQYKDANNNVWVVRGYKLTLSNGTYSGKIKFGIFQADPNYPNQTGGSSPQGAFPSSGTMTKTNGLAGDATISYSAAENVYYNPFWNPTTNELDFQYYQTYWGLPTPNVLILQYGVNEVSSYLDFFMEKNNSQIQTAVARLQTLVTKFHAQYPNAKIIYGLEPYGCTLPGYNGNQTNYGAYQYSNLSLAEAIYDAFDNATYNSYLYLNPVYARFNHEYGYGAIVEQQLSDIYTGLKIRTLANGLDGVHPASTQFGAIEEARSYRPIVNLIASSL